jgi:hypothetical protein
MNDLYRLPTEKTMGTQTYTLRADYRNILDIFGCLEDRSMPEHIRWLTALALFYEPEVAPEHRQEAMEYLAYFLRCGEAEGQPGPKLLDWQQDCGAIIAGVNRVAGQEVRLLPFVHWWTFLSWFHAMGEGQLSTVVSIRDKLYRGQKLSDWEKEFYRQNKQRVDLKPRYTADEIAEQNRLKEMLK